MDLITNQKELGTRGKVFLIAYNGLWVVDVTSIFMCFEISSVETFIFSVVSKLLSFVAWWTVYRKRLLIQNSVGRITFVSNTITTRVRCCSGIILRLCVGFLILIICLPSVYALLEGLNKDRQTYKRSCGFLSVGSDSIYFSAMSKFFWKLLNQHLDWSIHYAVAVLFCFCCKQLGSTIRKLCSKKHYFSTHRIWQRYYNIRKCLKEIEERYSFLVFVFIGRSFVEFFRVLTFIFNKDAVHVDFVFSVITCAYSLVILIVFISVVMSASHLLSDYRTLCERMIELPRDLYYSEEDFEASKLFMKLLDDKDTMTLTGWGLFQLKKNLFLTAAATLVSYGVLLLQFH
ncbi:hypothetical protein JTE90_001286 [Oedothorax gibbosus]|uniref:Gustatory receptor n=1 Tax=Oedothorax gibbosus TaxID=931172 RepID=A0AAV6V1N9_9ARAC|nr:hypothetical protein JTE90_001286 [Oedothorax gibbosus]